MRDMEQTRPEANQTDKDQVDRDDVIENTRHKKDQYTCDQRDQRLDHKNV
jgi:hypothetical protein